MAADLDGAIRFVTTSARLLDRVRLGLALGTNDGEPALRALDAYGNADGGYGWGLEPDLRSPESQPVAALHAFEVLEVVGAAGEERALRLADWLATASLADGGLPFALPVGDPTGCAPFWVEADHDHASLHVTAMVAAIAWRTADAGAPALAEHPWLLAATDHVARRLLAGEQPAGAHELAFVLQFLDALVERRADLQPLLALLASDLPDDGLLPVEGGAEGEVLRPLLVSPEPGRPLRRAYADDLIEAELDRLEAEQLEDGGWTVDFELRGPAAAVDWRGHTTVRAVTTLRRHDRL